MCVSQNSKNGNQVLDTNGKQQTCKYAPVLRRTTNVPRNIAVNSVNVLLGKTENMFTCRTRCPWIVTEISKWLNANTKSNIQSF